jgi:hypothetical protein
MPGNYSITTRAPGTVLTASIYNADHQNHVNNATPQGLDDYSETVTQMQLVADPGESGLESLPTSIAGELERLRFVIQEIKTRFNSVVPHWYSSLTDPLEIVTGTSVKLKIQADGRITTGGSVVSQYADKLGSITLPAASSVFGFNQCKCWCNVINNGTASIEGGTSNSFNTANAVRNSVGTVTVTYAIALPKTVNCIVATCFGTNAFALVSARSTTNFQVQTMNSSGTLVDANFSVIVMGSGP